MKWPQQPPPPSRALQRLTSAVQQPLEMVSIRELQQLWQHDDIVITCERPPGLEDAPDLAQRIRGALGNALEELCQYAPRRSDPFERESAYELLFGWTNPLIHAGIGQREVAVPFTVQADMEAGQVRILIRLFGTAAIHLACVRDAAVIALHSGISLRKGAARAAFPVRSLDWQRFDGSTRNWLDNAGSVVLRLLSPVIIRSGEAGEFGRRADLSTAQSLIYRKRRSGQAIRLEPQAIARSAIWRAFALAPWMGFNLAAEMRELHHVIDSSGYAIDIFPERWVRFSKRSGDEAINVTAYGGKITLSGSLEPLVPYLELAELTSLGGSCASGFGRVEVIGYP